MFQREGKSARAYFCQELDEIESVVKSRDFLLELARQENNYRDYQEEQMLPFTRERIMGTSRW
jgi:hypothetical protein